MAGDIFKNTKSLSPRSLANAPKAKNSKMLKTLNSQIAQNSKPV